MDEVIIDRLKELSREKKIACPSCGERLIRLAGSEQDTFEICDSDPRTSIIALRHRQCMSKSVPKRLFICTGCGARSKHSKRNVKRGKCKCPSTDIDNSSVHPPPAANAFEEEVTETNTSSDHNPFECLDDAMEEISQQGTHPTNLDDGLLNSALESSDRAVEAPSSSMYQTRLLFSQSGEWPERSKKFFVREFTNQGDGLRGLVYNALISRTRESDFSSLRDEEMYQHLHIAGVYLGLSQSKAIRARERKWENHLRNQCIFFGDVTTTASLAQEQPQTPKLL